MPDIGTVGTWRFINIMLLAIGAVCCCGCWEVIQYTPQPSAESDDVQEVQLSEEHEPLPQTAGSATTSQSLPRNSEQSGPTVSESASPEPASEMPKLVESPEETQVVEDNSDEAILDALFATDDAGAASTATEQSSPLQPAPSVPDMPSDSTLTEAAKSPPDTELQVWRLGSYWSLGAAYFAKNAPTESYQPRLQKAAAAAGLLQLELPELPDMATTDDRVAAIVAYLIDDRGPILAEEITRRFDPQQAALLQLAARSHVLLLVYSPRNKQFKRFIDQLEQSAQASGLPEQMWGELVERLRQRAPFLEVKQAVYALHEQVEAMLGAQD